MTLQPGTPYGTDAYLVMLSVQDSVARRVDLIYSQAADDLTEFMYQAEQGNLVLTASEQRYYAALRDEADRLARIAQREAGTLLDQTITSAFVEGALTHADDLAFNVVHDQAVRALSGYSLDLIQQTTDTMRRAVQQQIGVALVEGLSAAELRQRILTTGLSNIPRWRSVQERAGVIARTEIMRAYNTGALAGIQATGAHFVRWIASPDEATCSICGPRHGKVFRLPGVKIGGIDDPYGPAIGGLPSGEPPAHPRCRCTIRAVYRDQSGRVIARQTPTTPKVPEGGLTAGQPVPPHAPSAGQSFEDELGRLTENPGLLHNDEFVRRDAYWRGLKPDDEQIAALARVTRDPAAFQGYTNWRFGLDTVFDKGQIAAWKSSTELRLQVITALERYARVQPGLVGGPTFRRFLIGQGPKGLGSRMGSNTLADCWSNGTIRMPATRALPYIRSQVRVSANGVDEILTHELGHAHHNIWRYGLDPDGRFREFSAIRARSAPWRNLQADPLAGVKYIQADRDAWARLVAEWDSLPDVPLTYGTSTHRTLTLIDDAGVAHKVGAVNIGEARFNLEYMDKRLANAQALAAKAASAAAKPDMIPTQYAASSIWEDYAESSMMYLLDGAQLARVSPARYAFFQRIFGAIE